LAILSIYLLLIPVSWDLFSFFIIIGLKNKNETKEKIKKAMTKTYGFLVYKDKTAQINDANEKFKKNMLGVNISNIRNAIPHVVSICHKII
jgi:hypothetical protein